MTLKDLMPGQEATIRSLGERGVMRRRIMDMGLTPGTIVKVIKVAPLGDPIEINIRNYELSLRKDEAEQIQVELQ